MGRRVVACGRPGGGELIPTTRTIGARVGPAVAALALVAGVVAYTAAAADRLPGLLAGVGAIGWTVIAIALVGRWPSLLPLGLAGVGAGYAVFLSLRSGTVDPRAPFVAAALFAAAELGFWSVERLAGRSEGAVLVRRLLFLGAGALATATLGGLLLLATAGVSGGVGLEAIGILAAVTALAIVALLAARART